MIENAVLRLRAERLVYATRPSLARGNCIHRCQRRLLSLKQYLCATLVSVQVTSRFCLMMFDTEPVKPSNTNRFITDILPDIEASQQSRIESSQGLLDLAAHPDYQPVVVFPASCTGLEHQILSAPSSGGPPLSITLDGIWTEVCKMFRKSLYLDVLPIISADLSRISAYHLREAYADEQYCTAEVTTTLLDLAGSAPATAVLGEHSTHSQAHYLAGKTQRKGSITADQVEDV